MAKIVFAFLFFLFFVNDEDGLLQNDMVWAWD